MSPYFNLYITRHCVRNVLTIIYVHVWFHHIVSSRVVIFVSIANIATRMYYMASFWHLRTSCYYTIGIDLHTTSHTFLSLYFAWNVLAIFTKTWWYLHNDIWFSPMFCIWLCFKTSTAHIVAKTVHIIADDITWYLWPLLLTWFNFNPSMDK